MDSLFAVGVLKQKVSGGITYYDLDVDFLCVSGESPSIPFAEEPEPEEMFPSGEQWEDMQRTRELWQRVQGEETLA